MRRSIVELKREFNSIDNLPTLPVIVLHILNMLNSNKSMKQVGEVISIDPAIVTKILKVANSAFYGIRVRVDNIRRALVLLGTNEITHIVLGVSLFNTFKDSQSEDSIDRTKFWEHSALVGHIAKIMALEFGFPSNGEEYTAGLIHDIGKFIMDQYFKTEFIESIEIVKSLGEINYKAETDALGATHMMLGAWLAEKWKLPKNLCTAIRYHHHPEKANEHAELAALINMADYFANILEYNATEINMDQYNIENAKNILGKYTQNFNEEKFLIRLEREGKQIRKFLQVIIQHS